jgi:uncharacterized membrane protein
MRFLPVAGTSEDLNTLNNSSVDGGSWLLVDARGTNGREIVGWGSHEGKQRAFLLEPGAAPAPNLITDLGMPPTFPGDNYVNTSIAHDVNAGGVVVGAIYDLYGSWPYEPFVWTAEKKMIDLNALIDPTTGWHLQAAYAINDNNDVVGWGTFNGQVRGFKLHLPASIH